MQLIAQQKTPPRYALPLQRRYQEEPEYRTMDSENARRLWAAVMERAILDLQDHSLRTEAVEWINSKRHNIGSFNWVCNQLDMNPNSVKRALLGTYLTPCHLSPPNRQTTSIFSQESIL